MINYFFKYCSLKWNLIIILLFVPFFVDAQTTLRDSIELSIEYIETDLGKAESLLKIDTDNLLQEPDSIILDYYYYSAAVLELKGDTTFQKTDLLLKAKALLEKSLGINQPVYFEIINAIGEQLYDKKRYEEAKLIWEEGLIKGLSFNSYTDSPIGQNIASIQSNLSKLYEKQGDSYISTCLNVEYTKGTFKYAYDLWEKALNTQTINPNLSLRLLDDAKLIFENTGKDGQEMLGPLYRVYISTYAQLNDAESALFLIKKYKNLIITYCSYDSYISDLLAITSVFALKHFDVSKANFFYEILRTDISKASDSQRKQFIKEEQAFLMLCNLQNKIDSLNVEISQIPTKHLVKRIKYSYDLSLLYLKREQYDKVIEISEECNEKIKISSLSIPSLQWNVLSNLVFSFFELKQYAKCEKYISESLDLLNKNKSYTSNYSSYLMQLYNTLSICLIYQNKLDQALGISNLVLQGYESLFGINSLEYSTALHNRGRIYQLRKEYKKAIDYYNESLKISTSLQQKENPKTLQYLNEVEKCIKAQL